MMSPHYYAMGKQAWLEHVAAALKDNREALIAEELRAPAEARDWELFDSKLRAIDQRSEANRRELNEHRALMREVKAYDARCRARAGWP